MKLEKYLSNQCQSVLKRKQGSLESYVRKSFYSYIDLDFKNHTEQSSWQTISLSHCSILSDSFRFRDVVHLRVLFVLFCLFGRATEEMEEKKNRFPWEFLMQYYSNICICKNDFLTITSVHDNICFLEKSLFATIPSLIFMTLDK